MDKLMNKQSIIDKAINRNLLGTAFINQVYIENTSMYFLFVKYSKVCKLGTKPQNVSPKNKRPWSLLLCFINCKQHLPEEK